MALSPADFYAYSRATGAPIPEDPQERAEMAPEVLEFRRNQLRAPQQESNTLQTLGTAALGLGAAIGAGLAARRFLGGRSKAAFQIPKAPAKSATAGVTQADLSNLQKAAGRPTVTQTVAQEIPASKPVAPSQPAPGTTENALAIDPTDKLLEELGQMQASRKQALESRMSQAYSRRMKTAEELLGQLQAEGPDLTVVQQPTVGERLRGIGFAMQGAPVELGGEGIGLYSEKYGGRDLPLSSPVAQKALKDAGVTEEEALSYYVNRNKETWDRIAKEINEPDVTSAFQTLVNQHQAAAPARSNQFANAVQSGEDQMTGRMKMQLSRNEDLDMSQVELLENIAAENEALMRDYADPAQMQGFVNDDAINEAASRLPDGLPVDQAEGATRMSSQDLADVAKSRMMALRQDLEARGLRPGTQRFERELARTWTTKAVPGAEPGSTAFRELQEQGQVELTLPGVIRSAVERVEELPEEEGLEMKFLRSVPNVGPGAEVTSTAAGTAIRGASPVYETVEPQQRTRQIFGNPDVLVPEVPDETMPDYPASYSAMHQILAKTELPERIDPYAKKRLAGGSAGIGVYGPELSYVPGAMSKLTGEYSKAAGRKPSYVPKWLQQREGPTGFGAMTSAQILSGAQKAPEGRVRNAFEAELARRTRAKESLAVSEMLRRGRIEGLI